MRSGGTSGCADLYALDVSFFLCSTRKMHRDRVSPASLLLASVAASPPCRPVLVHQWRYSRCIEMEAHLHRDCGHQRRLRRLSSQHWFASWLWQMHRDQVSPASRLLASVGGFAALSSSTGLPVGYGRCIEIRSHLHRDCWHQRRLRRLVVQYWCAGGAILWMHGDGGSSASRLRASAAASPPVVPGTGLPVGYGRCIEIRSHLHRDCWHQWRLRRLVVQYWCAGGAILWMHRDGGSSASRLRASAAASPPCPGTGVPVGYGRCIEIGSHLHCYCGHQRRLRRPVVQYRFASWLWQMHRDRVSPALLLRASEAASPPCRPSAGLPVGYGRCIEIGSHIAIAGIRGGFAVSSFRYWCTSGAMADT